MVIRTYQLTRQILSILNRYGVELECRHCHVILEEGDEVVSRQTSGVSKNRLYCPDCKEILGLF